MSTILVNNGNLGRMGKTTIAYSIYKMSKVPFRYVTNDLENASVDLEENIDKYNLLHFPNGTKIDMDFSGNIVFDFGGKPDDRLMIIAEFVDFIVVPIYYQSDSELELTVKNLNTLIEVNENIILVINNTDKEESKRIKTALKFNPQFKKIKILQINHSKYIRRLANDNQTVFEVAESNKADATRLNKVIIPQFKELFSTLNITI